MFENVWLVATALDIFTRYSKVLMTLCRILRQENSIFHFPIMLDGAAAGQQSARRVIRV